MTSPSAIDISKRTDGSCAVIASAYGRARGFRTASRLRYRGAMVEDGAALVLGEAAPDPVRLADLQRVVEARDPHRARVTDRLRPALLWPRARRAARARSAERTLSIPVRGTLL